MDQVIEADRWWQGRRREIVLEVIGVPLGLFFRDRETATKQTIALSRQPSQPPTYSSK